MTLVVDASVIAEYLLGTERGVAAGRALGTHALVAPGHLPAEVLSVIRGWALGGHLADEEAQRAIDEFPQLGVELVDATALMSGAWRLRHNISAYDALYVALAEALDCSLLTTDARLAAAAPRVAVTP